MPTDCRCPLPCVYHPTVTAHLCGCGHPESDHSESNDGSCVYGWDDFQPLDDAEREADACPCEAFAMLEDATR